VIADSYRSNSGTLSSNRQNTSRPKYNDDISLLISQYLISGQEDGRDKGWEQDTQNASGKNRLLSIMQCWEIGSTKHGVLIPNTKFKN
jgi:hypothetical protein